MTPGTPADGRKARVLRTTLAIVVLAASTILVGSSPQTQPPPIAKGPFAPTVASLTTYRSPEWFRDAKLGIWAHWGPQSVPMAGDWYARRMYEQGHRQYQHHLENYGHPSQLGYKDIIPLWKAEKWDPDRLMALYKRAGARYFVSMGVHHDNFDLWNSTHHRWNAVKMGPMRDVVGAWQQAAKKHGLRFGVSEHLGASFTWWQSSRGADKTGPMAGVPYDGANPQYEDLYHPAAAPGDKAWYSTNPAWHLEWFDRIKDLVDQYHPDLLYTDGGLPFGETGRNLVAHFYNTNAARHGGRIEAVYTCKPIGSGEFVQGECVQDMERGVLSAVNPLPWQTDTSIGDWFYNRDWKSRPVSWVIHMLVDIVSKNGNLLLNVVQRPDGSLDPEVERMLDELAAWTSTNGDAIYGSRPWVVHGEGPARSDGGHFKEDVAYTSQDVRFTTKGDALYAIVMGWPGKSVTISSLATSSPHVKGRVRDVTLLGHAGKIAWTQDEHALTITVPDRRPGEYAFAFRVLGVIR